MKKISVSSYQSGIAANNSGCADGPKAIQDYLTKHPIHTEFNWQPPTTPSQQLSGKAALDEVTSLCQQVAEQTKAAIGNQQPFLTLGGDHSVAAGTWSGAAAALRQQGDIGLIWIDAHMDSHTFETTPSDNIHGMPLAALLGHGAKELLELGDDQPKLKPGNVVLLGIRSFEHGEAELLKKLDVKVFFMDEIEERGFTAVMQDAIRRVSMTTAGFGVSIDLDGIDPEDAPGVGCPEPGGIHANDLIAGCKLIAKDPKFIGADIVEYNPHEDKQQKTLDVTIELIKSLFTKN
jgi:arginase